MKNLENLIVKKIRNAYALRLITPVIYLIVLVILWFVGPVGSFVLIGHENSLSGIAKNESNANRCVEITLRDLRFTGYTQTRFSITSGYYYYAMDDGKCYLVLLTPEASEQGLSIIDEITIRAAVKHISDETKPVIEGMADKLQWSADGLEASMCPIMLSQPDISTVAGVLLMVFYAVSGMIALICVIRYTVFIIAPHTSPTASTLGLFGKRKELLAQATEELATLPQLATEDIYITENFFIAFTKRSVTVLPISEIVWVYKHSTLHKFLWYHFAISYTLHIVANKHIYVQLPKNMKSDIDGIIDYLSEANHNILIGFDESNRQTVQKVMGINRFWGAFLSIMNQRV